KPRPAKAPSREQTRAFLLTRMGAIWQLIVALVLALGLLGDLVQQLLHAAGSVLAGVVGEAQLRKAPQAEPGPEGAPEAGRRAPQALERPLALPLVVVADEQAHADVGRGQI